MHTEVCERGTVLGGQSTAAWCCCSDEATSAMGSTEQWLTDSVQRCTPIGSIQMLDVRPRRVVWCEPRERLAKFELRRAHCARVAERDCTDERGGQRAREGRTGGTAKCTRMWPPTARRRCGARRERVHAVDSRRLRRPFADQLPSRKRALGAQRKKQTTLGECDPSCPGELVRGKSSASTTAGRHDQQALPSEAKRGKARQGLESVSNKIEAV